MFLPFDLFLVASRIDLRDSPLEISRGRKREWAKQFGEGGGERGKFSTHDLSR